MWTTCLETLGLSFPISLDHTFERSWNIFSNRFGSHDKVRQCILSEMSKAKLSMEFEPSFPKTYEPFVQHKLDQSFECELVQVVQGHRTQLSNGFGQKFSNKFEPSLKWHSDQAFKGIPLKFCKRRWLTFSRVQSKLQGTSDQAANAICTRPARECAPSFQGKKASESICAKLSIQGGPSFQWSLDQTIKEIQTNLSKGFGPGFRPSV